MNRIVFWAAALLFAMLTNATASTFADEGSIGATFGLGAKSDDIDKAQSINGYLSFSGSASWSGNNQDQTVTFSFDRLTNLSTTHFSGTIQVRIILTLAPIVPGQPFSYWNLGTYQLPDQLLPGYYYSNVSQTVPMLSLPPNGVYYVHIGAFEYEPGCGGTGDFCIDDWITFNNRVEVVFPYITNYTGGTPSGATTIAVEYYNSSFGHYFVTADPSEIAGLDAGAYNFAFIRTGQTWKVWTSGTALDVCRFFTTPGTFGVKSSHFYTAILSECNGLKANPNWIYEKIAGKVLLPVGGACPVGTLPLYRLYNNGITGAPNHRYTISQSIRSQMIGQGFSPEDANTACVPQ